MARPTRKRFFFMVKYSELIGEWLIDLGYTTCFFVAGGNIMHLLDVMRTRFTCIPVVHEVAAGIAVEYFNETAAPQAGRAFAMVTAGPGLTNIVTALGGAWLESRELLVLGGQVKSSDLSDGTLRQRGIQEIDGVAIARPLCVHAERIEKPISKTAFYHAVEQGSSGRKGPVFLEFCLDAQAVAVERSEIEAGFAPAKHETYAAQASVEAKRIAPMVAAAQRPVLLIGGGVSHATALDLATQLTSCSVALMTTWNGMDRVDGHAKNFFGRPNQWGQRHANVLIQQSDLVVAIGTRLGMQQTGFNWQAFARDAKVVQIDIDRSELEKGHPHVSEPLQVDADTFLRALLEEPLGEHAAWLSFCADVRAALPLNDPQNVTRAGFIDPYVFASELSAVCTKDDVVIPCSSGGAFTTMMQGFTQRLGQTVITNKGLASMGYGLSAAIGAACAARERRTICVEGDGGFTQNLQELATMAVNKLNLKLFIFSNEGYASIRMTQRNYFGGDYLGCDVNTGLGFPNWTKLFEAYDIPVHALSAEGLEDEAFTRLFAQNGPAAFIVPIDPEQTFYPKIASRVTASGGMESAPLHLMTPDLPAEVAEAVFAHLAVAAR